MKRFTVMPNFFQEKMVTVGKQLQILIQTKLPSGSSYKTLIAISHTISNFTEKNVLLLQLIQGTRH